MGFIYKITNTITGKLYIGETCMKDPVQRWKGHLNSIKQGRGCPALRDAIKKYGLENFKFEVMIICFDDDRFIYEQEYIKRYNTQSPNGYNILKGGICGGGFIGHKHSEETKQILSKKSKEYYSDPEKRREMSDLIREKMKGINISERVRNSEKWQAYIKDRRNGNKTLSEEQKKKISLGLKRYFSSKDENSISEARLKLSNIKIALEGKTVSQFDIKGNYIKTYPSISTASRETGISQKTISNNLNGRTKSAGSYVWKFVQ